MKGGGRDCKSKSSPTFIYTTYVYMYLNSCTDLIRVCIHIDQRQGLLLQFHIPTHVCVSPILSFPPPQHTAMPNQVSMQVAYVRINVSQHASSFPQFLPILPNPLPLPVYVPSHVEPDAEQLPQPFWNGGSQMAPLCTML